MTFTQVCNAKQKASWRFAGQEYSFHRDLWVLNYNDDFPRN